MVRVWIPADVWDIFGFRVLHSICVGNKGLGSEAFKPLVALETNGPDNDKLVFFSANEEASKSLGTKANSVYTARGGWGTAKLMKAVAPKRAQMQNSIKPDKAKKDDNHTWARGDRGRIDPPPGAKFLTPPRLF